MRPRPEKERALAESLFITEGKSAREIGGLIGAGKETVQRWAREGKWHERRRLRRGDSPLAALERLTRERDRLIATLGGAKPAGDPRGAGQPGAGQPAAPDAAAAGETIAMIQKLTQTIEKMQPRREDDDIDAMLATMDRFSKFVMAHADDEDCEAVRQLLEEFLDEERQRSL